MPAPLLKRPASAPYFHPHILIFQICPHPGEVLKTYSLPPASPPPSPPFVRKRRIQTMSMNSNLHYVIF